MVVVYASSSLFLDKALQKSCNKIADIARNESVVQYLDSWASKNIIDQGYRSVSAMLGKVKALKGDESIIISPPEEKLSGIKAKIFRIGVSKLSDDVDAEITQKNIGQIEFGQGRNRVIMLKNSAELKSYRGHDELSGHLLKINDATFAYCANAKFEN